LRRGGGQVQARAAHARRAQPDHRPDDPAGAGVDPGPRQGAARRAAGAVAAKRRRGVPREQAPLVAAASEYCKLREESWRRRSEALHKRNMKMLRDAELSERAALDAFPKMR